MSQQVLDNLSLLLVVAYLRVGETDNCVAHHTSQSCIWPIRGGGIHQDKTGVQAVMALLNDLFQRQPDNLLAAWFMNLAAMAAGEYPQAVPLRWRLPADTFDTTYDIGRFTDIAPQLGVNAFDQAGGAITEDFDNDGFIDIATTTCLPSGPMHYFHADGRGGYEDRTRRSGLHGQLGGLICVQTDFDNDGFLVILVLRGGWLGEAARQVRRSLLRNNGDNTFTDVTRAAGLADPMYPSQSCEWADYDADGDLDLYVGNEAPLQQPDQGYPSLLYRNNGDGTFTDVADAAGVRNERYTKGVAWGDYDNDGDPDLYVSNIGPNRLYRNNGNDTFTDVAKTAGVIEPIGRSFACWFFDYDNDGWLDLWVGPYGGTVLDIAAHYFRQPDRANRARLYHNRGDGTFEDATRAAGLDRPMLPMGANYGDLDNDGFLDFYLGTGAPPYESLMPNLMFRNDAGKRFIAVTFSGGFGHLQKGHAVCFADLDNDGDQDIYHQLGGFYDGDAFANALFENPGHGGHWITLKCVGGQSNRLAVGTRLHLVVRRPNGQQRSIHATVGSAGSFGGSTFQQEIGLGDAEAIVRIEAVWPRTRLRQEFRDVPMDAFYELREGDAQLHRPERRKTPFRRAGGAADSPRG